MAGLLAFLDATIVNIAFPDISRSFAGSGRGELSWVLDGYFVVIAALLVSAGGLADRFGHKRIFLLGVTGFTAASLLCAVSPSLELLIGGRRGSHPRRGAGRALLLAARLPRQPADRSGCPPPWPGPCASARSSTAACPTCPAR